MAAPPVGGSRVVYAVVATVLAAMGGALVALVAWPLVVGEQTCADDPTELCTLALAVVGYTRGFWLVLAWLAHAMRLGWLFVMLVIVGQAVGAQIGIETESLWPVAGVVALIPLAAWVTMPGPLLPERDVTFGRVPDEPLEVPSRRRYVIIAIAAVLALQLVWWVWLLMN